MRFPDVPETHWAWKEIDQATDLGLFDGYHDGTFRPDEPVTRAQLAKVANNIIEHLTPQPEPEPEPPPVVDEKVPAGAVPVADYQDLQNKVAAEPAGTIFLLPSMTMSGRLPLKGGNQYWGNPDQPPTLQGAGPNGHPFVVAETDGVQLHHLNVREFGPHNDKERGAMIGSEGHNGAGWIITHLDAGYTANTVVDFGGGWTMEDSVLHHAGRHWATGGGRQGRKVARRVEAHNIADDTGGIPRVGDSNRGSKFAFTSGWLLEDAYVHDVDGMGIWFDLGNDNAEIIRPRVERCTRSGIMLEVSYGPFLVESPVVVDCAERQSGPDGWPAHAGILVSLTPDVTVNNPEVVGGRHGMTVISWAHPALTNNRLLDPSRLGCENIVFDGGSVTGVDVYDAGMAGGQQAGLRPTRNVRWDGVNFDTDARFRSGLSL